MLSRAEKVAMVEELNQKLKKAKAVILTDFKGLKVGEINELRYKLRESAIEYKVIKNTIIRLAAKDTPLENLTEKICAPNALAISYKDPITLAKKLVEFKKKSALFNIKSGFLEGQILQSKQIEELARLPNREILLAQLLATMSAGPRQFVGLLYNIIAKLFYLLEEINRQKQDKEV